MANVECHQLRYLNKPIHQMLVELKYGVWSVLNVKQLEALLML